ncbi:MAG: MATE family efflux transporter [Odoribacter sp.]|nr:MATE family efflux transporter [Odoribacter sp.]
MNRKILSIAIPAIVSNITVPLLGLVDTAIMGHMGDTAFIGAIAVGSTMYSMLYMLFGFLRMGTSGLTAQANGAGDLESSAATLYRSLLISLTIGIILIAMAWPTGTFFLDFLDADDSVAPLARVYFLTAIWGAPAVLATYTLNGWFLGMHNTRTPMWIAIASNIINICLSVTLVYVFNFEIQGVAIGTATAQWAGALIGVRIVKGRYSLPRPSMKRLAEPCALKRLFSINTDIFLRTLCLVGVTAWFTRTGASQGVIILSANALLMQFFLFFSYFCDGFAFAGNALTGSAAGGGADKAHLRTIRNTVMLWGAGIAIIFTISYIAGGQFLLTLLTDRAEVVDAAREYLTWAAAVPLCGTGAFIYDGIFVGLTHTRPMLWSMLVSAAVFFGVLYTFMPALGNHAVWLAFIAYLASRGLFLHIAFKIRPDSDH